MRKRGRTEERGGKGFRYKQGRAVGVNFNVACMWRVDCLNVTIKLSR